MLKMRKNVYAAEHRQNKYQGTFMLSVGSTGFGWACLYINGRSGSGGPGMFHYTRE